MITSRVDLLPKIKCDVVATRKGSTESWIGNASKGINDHRVFPGFPTYETISDIRILNEIDVGDVASYVDAYIRGINPSLVIPGVWSYRLTIDAYGGSVWNGVDARSTTGTIEITGKVTTKLIYNVVVEPTSLDCGTLNTSSPIIKKCGSVTVIQAGGLALPLGTIIEITVPTQRSFDILARSAAGDTWNKIDGSPVRLPLTNTNIELGIDPNGPGTVPGVITVPVLLNVIVP